jgi:acyl carrier protein phosphodiesterase
VNFLFHLFLSGDDPELLVGNLMGDFVRGRLKGHYPAGIEEGIALHRHIDSFADGNRYFLNTKHRINGSFGHYRGILADIFHDHFLAVRWEDHGRVPFSLFLSRARQALHQYEEILPDRLRRIVPLMLQDWLPSYHRIDGIASALIRMSFRVKRANPLAKGAGELTRHYEEFYGDFQGLFPELIECCKSCPLTRA